MFLTRNGAVELNMCCYDATRIGCSINDDVDVSVLIPEVVSIDRDASTTQWCTANTADTWSVV